MAAPKKPAPTAVTRQQAIVNEAARLVIAEGYEPTPAIITACETVPNTTASSRQMARLLWLTLINRIRREAAAK
jgi:hypothetical protein